MSKRAAFPQLPEHHCIHSHPSAFLRNRPRRDASILRDLDKRDTSILKGLAITAIVFHNFFHLVGLVHQNEFSFDPARFWGFLRALNTPTTAIEGFFIFFGHYGVELFVFLAAYGLAKSHWDDSVSWARFLWGRVKKLYPAFGLVVLPWFISMAWLAGPDCAFRAYGAKLIWMFAGVSNLIPGCGVPPIGPWWFIPFIVQFYALWPLLRQFANRFGQRGLLVLSVLCSILVFVTRQPLSHWSISLIATPIGHMPEFCLGIAAARFRVQIHSRIILVAAAALLLGNVYGILWPFTYISALVLSLAVYVWMRRQLRESKVWAQIGEFSALIFLLNGIVKYRFIFYAHSPQSQLLFGCISAITSIAVAAIIHYMLMPHAIAKRFGLSADAPGEMLLQNS
ncbi:MAG: acyltransferase [Terracidiphilus sp.]